MDSVVAGGLYLLFRKAGIDDDYSKISEFLDTNPKYQNWDYIKDLDVITAEREYDERSIDTIEFDRIFLRYPPNSLKGCESMLKILSKYRWPCFKIIHQLLIDCEFDLFKETWIRNSKFIDLNYENTFKILKTTLELFGKESSIIQASIEDYLDFYLSQGMNFNIVFWDAVIYDLNDYYFLEYLPYFIARGADPTIKPYFGEKDLIDQLPSWMGWHEGSDKYLDFHKKKLINTITKWEARKFLPVKFRLSKVFSLLMTKQIIKYLIHNKADIEKVWQLIMQVKID